MTGMISKKIDPHTLIIFTLRKSTAIISVFISQIASMDVEVVFPNSKVLLSTTYSLSTRIPFNISLE